ncbi:hypothetical protein DFJ58DRAFT_853250 [Suillus subalutaceus]|uniref:uncharacterized protein n=1 Tax=Suillus subalutaceus TaxID=48586 RepID=UPI001B870145|nr:uncharacterized protein DFJ58DRAFT_853250 [Suillus subalutaceus]KAG1844038.1 hypothetical protein DFJ58DRAFT_853250 [Suillus subalutaceus]
MAIILSGELLKKSEILREPSRDGPPPWRSPDQGIQIRMPVLGELGTRSHGYQEHTKTRTATIVLSGPTANHLDDLDNSVNVIESLIEDPRLVPGPSTTEPELSKLLIEANGSGIRKLAQHLLKFIPRTLAENALGGAEGNEVLNSIVVLRFFLLSLQKPTIEGLLDEDTSCDTWCPCV